MVHHAFISRVYISSCISVTCLLIKCSMFIVHCYSSLLLDFSTSMFTDPSSSSSITWLLLLSHLFYTSPAYVLNSYTVYTIIYLPLQFSPYNALSFIYVISINPMISVHMHFLQQYSVYSIISYSISYKSFHILFHILPHWGVNYSVYLCIYFFLSYSHN